MNLTVTKPKHMEMTMTKNHNYIKHLFLSCLAVVLIAVPGTALAGMPDPIKTELLEKGKKVYLDRKTIAESLKYTPKKSTKKKNLDYF